MLFYQSFDSYNWKTKHLKDERNIISGYLKGDEQDSAINFLELLDHNRVKIYQILFKYYDMYWTDINCVKIQSRLGRKVLKFSIETKYPSNIFSQ